VIATKTRGVVVGALRSQALREASPQLVERGWRERVFRVDEHVVCVACGVVPDAKQLLRALQRVASEYRRTWGARAPPQVLAQQVSDFLQRATARTGNRPFGAAFLIAGYDDASRDFKLFLTDPAGFFDEFHAQAIVGDVPEDAEAAFSKSADRRAPDLPSAERRARDLLRDSLTRQQGRAQEDDGNRLRPFDPEFARLFLSSESGEVVAEILSADDIRALLSSAEEGSPPPPPPSTEDDGALGVEEETTTDDEVEEAALQQQAAAGAPPPGGSS